MDKRETLKNVEIDGRKFTVKKFDAMTGSYIAYKLMAELLPAGMSAKLGVPSTSDKKMMSKEDFFDLQKDCLRVCEEPLPVGSTPVLDTEGNFQVIGLEQDAKTVLALTFYALTFNLSSFFDASLSNSLAEAMSTIFPPDAKT